MLPDDEGRPQWLPGDQLTDLFAARWRPGLAGAVLPDGEGRPQWLPGGRQADVLRPALHSYRGSSQHGLLVPLEPVMVQAAGLTGGFAAWLDCGTPADLAAARQSWYLRAEPERSDRHDHTRQLDYCDLREAGHRLALVDVRQVLDLARVAAHQIERPAEPLTAYLLDLAVGTEQPAD